MTTVVTSEIISDIVQRYLPDSSFLSVKAVTHSPPHFLVAATPSALGFSRTSSLCLDNITGILHLSLAERLHPIPSAPRCAGHITNSVMFTGVEKMDALDKIRSTSFSTSLSANADL